MSTYLCSTPEFKRYDWYTEDAEEIVKCKRICNLCPAKAECGQQALDNFEIWGIWGGMEDFKRRRAFALTSTEKVRARMRTMLCPNCQSDDLVLPSRKTNGLYHVSCGNCEVHWKTHKLPTKTRRIADKRESVGHRLGEVPVTD